MRIWDVTPSLLCRKHLLGEHRELHATWSIITQNKKGYSRHPEVVRWKGKLNALYKRHETLVLEMEHRRYNHKSPLNKELATGLMVQDTFINPPQEQLLILKNKKCECMVVDIIG